MMCDICVIRVRGGMEMHISTEDVYFFLNIYIYIYTISIIDCYQDIKRVSASITKGFYKKKLPTLPLTIIKQLGPISQTGLLFTLYFILSLFQL